MQCLDSRRGMRLLWILTRPPPSTPQTVVHHSRLYLYHVPFPSRFTSLPSLIQSIQIVQQFLPSFLSIRSSYLPFLPAASFYATLLAFSTPTPFPFDLI
jgi:hypothetical protein